jgi:hypothetical protein
MPQHGFETHNPLTYPQPRPAALLLWVRDQILLVVSIVHAFGIHIGAKLALAKRNIGAIARLHKRRIDSV